MLIVLVTLFIAITIIVFIINLNFDSEILGGITIISMLCAVVSLVALVIVGVKYSSRMVIDEKIAVYHRENEKIEAALHQAVVEYLGYEGEIFNTITPEDMTAFAAVYPDIKANEVIVTWLETYTNNSIALRNLELEKLQYKIYGWWLCFKSN